MSDDPKSAEGKPEAQQLNGGVAQPPAAPPLQPPAPPDPRQPDNEPEQPNPILVRLVGGEDLEPFEVQTLAIARETLILSRRTYWIAIGAFLAAFAAAVFVGVQVTEIAHQNQILGSQSESAAAGATISEMNTRKQFDLTTQSMRVDQRAWIGITATGWTLQPPLPLAAGLKLQQLGKTPARNCVFRATVEIAKDESQVGFEFKKGDVINRADIDPILPTAIMNLKVSEPSKTVKGVLLLKPLSQTRFDAINKGDIQFFVHGKLTYDDAFAVHHWTEFCFVFEPNPALRTGQDIPFVNCQHHNGIDDNLE